MKDYILNGDGDMDILEGDFMVGEADLQHQYLLLMSDKGSFKQFPDMGVGVGHFLETEDEAELMREIRKQYEADGMQVGTIEYNKQKLKINAQYQ